MSLDTFKASYYWSGNYGAYEELEYVVIANSVSEALGFVLEAEPNTDAGNWSIDPIDTSLPHAVWISNRSS